MHPRARATATRHTKIVCTLGPASLQPATLRAMIAAGMDVARLNTSHGTLDEHLRAIALVREAERAAGRPIAVLVDLGGPKLRTGQTEGGQAIPLVAGERIHLTSRELLGTAAAVTVEYDRLTEDVAPGERVLIDDGRIELEVLAVDGDGLECRVVTGGPLLPRKGVSFPQSNLATAALTARDQEAMRATVRAGVDFFALSFVRDAGDLVRARQLLGELGSDVPLIAKIERRPAVENLAAILAESDGVMVARGDLGVELPPEDVPIWQRAIVTAGAKRMIPVITATQMLESMVDSPRPTRAESSDVANAVWELADALMLSGETAIGRYPVEAVAMMDRIIRRAESAIGDDPAPLPAPGTDDHSYVVARAAREIVESDENMRAIACFTRSGYTAFLVSKVHAQAPVYAITPTEPIWRRLALARGVVPLLAPLVGSSEELLRTVDRLLVERAGLRDGDEVVVVASMPVRTRGTTNFLKLHHIGESRDYPPPDESA